MTRLETQRRKRRIRRIQRAGAWVLLIAFELLLSAAPAAVTAAIILPAVYEKRGYYGIGSEWIFIAILFCFVFYTVHNRICDKLFEEE